MIEAGKRRYDQAVENACDSEIALCRDSLHLMAALALWLLSCSVMFCISRCKKNDEKWRENCLYNNVSVFTAQLNSCPLIASN